MSLLAPYRDGYFLLYSDFWLIQKSVKYCQVKIDLAGFFPKMLDV